MNYSSIRLGKNPHFPSDYHTPHKVFPESSKSEGIRAGSLTSGSHLLLPEEEGRPQASPSPPDSRVPAGPLPAGRHGNRTHSLSSNPLNMLGTCSVVIRGGTGAEEKEAGEDLKLPFPNPRKRSDWEPLWIRPEVQSPAQSPAFQNQSVLPLVWLMHEPKIVPSQASRGVF